MELRGKLKQILPVMLGIVLACMAVIFVMPEVAEAAEWENVESADWMAELDGNLMLNGISIPGTHDSATQYCDLSFFSKTQTTDIGEQLENGYRYLDIRLACDEEQLRLVHGFVSCRTGKTVFAGKLYFDAVLEQCYNFLQEHPKETVILCIKKDHGDETDLEFQELLYQYINEQPQFWYLKDEIPNLEEVRGRIVLARRFADEAGYGTEQSGIDMYWEDQGNTEIAAEPYEENEKENGTVVIVQDRYSYGTEDKWDAVRTCLEDPPLDTEEQAPVFINFLSTKGTKTFGHPVKYAKEINALFLEQPLDQGKNYGWIIMDYGTAELAYHVYSLN